MQLILNMKKIDERPGEKPEKCVKIFVPKMFIIIKLTSNLTTLLKHALKSSKRKLNPLPEKETFNSKC